jgi:hypothetical protein
MTKSVGRPVLYTRVDIQKVVDESIRRNTTVKAVCESRQKNAGKTRKWAYISVVKAMQKYQIPNPRTEARQHAKQEKVA